MGRELLRVLQSTGETVPEMRTLYNDLLTKTITPSGTSSPSNTEIPEAFPLLSVPSKTSRPFLSARVPHEIEQWLVFMMRNVKLGNERRYQEWFREKFLVCILW